MTFPTIFALSFGAVWIGIGIWTWKNEKQEVVLPAKTEPDFTIDPTATPPGGFVPSTQVHTATKDAEVHATTPSDVPKPGFGPDGYGHAYLRKEDYELVQHAVRYLNDQPREFPVFAVDLLAYPQYEHYYQLTKVQWKKLQDYCRLKLIQPTASEAVVAHWRSIVAGTVPFGLKVREDDK